MTRGDASFAAAEAGVQRFGYAAGIAPMLWVLMALSVVEIGVVHLLVGLFAGPAAALVLSMLSVGALILLVRLIRSLDRNPVELDRETLRMSAGILRPVSVPRAAVRMIRLDPSATDARKPGVLRLSLTAHPNVLIELARPLVHGRRTIEAIAHRLDEPDRFAAALDPSR